MPAFLWLPFVLLLVSTVSLLGSLLAWHVLGPTSSGRGTAQATLKGRNLRALALAEYLQGSRLQGIDGGRREAAAVAAAVGHALEAARGVLRGDAQSNGGNSSSSTGSTGRSTAAAAPPAVLARGREPAPQRQLPPAPEADGESCRVSAPTCMWLRAWQPNSRMDSPKLPCNCRAHQQPSPHLLGLVAGQHNSAEGGAAVPDDWAHAPRAALGAVAGPSKGAAAAERASRARRSVPAAL